MQDYPNTTDNARIRASANDDGRDNSHSREGDLASDKLGVPLLSDDPAPLSGALNIPTLLTDSPVKDKPGVRSQSDRLALLDDYTKAQLRGPEPVRPNGEPSEFDTFGRRRNAAERTGTAPVEGQMEGNRATTPAAPPRGDSATFVGVPSNHPQTIHSEKLAKLDKVALVVGAIIVIGPLFAAMVGRM